MQRGTGPTLPGWRRSRSGMSVPWIAPDPDTSGAGLMWDGIDSHMRVLLVEDAPFLRYAFGRLLRMHGFEVMEANDGREALECVPEFRPEMVVTDLRMPVMDG